MNNPFPYSFNEKRYHTFNYYLKTNFQSKVAKVCLDAGFSCPNRDGKKGYGGCCFCSLSGSGESNLNTTLPIVDQYQANKKIIDRKWDNRYYIPYFQSYSNTYGPLEKIKQMIEPFLKMDEVVQIAIATRCDCLDDEVISYLDEISHIKPIWLELGLQTSNNSTGSLLNRQYSFEDFTLAINKLSRTNIMIATHIINSLPYETRQDMLQTIQDISHLPISAIKIHMLSILKSSMLGKQYREKPFKLLSRDEYIEIVVRQLELLNPKIIIERLTGDPIKDELIAPNWISNKTTILNDIDKLMRKEDTYQGKYFHE